MWESWYKCIVWRGDRSSKLRLYSWVSRIWDSTVHYLRFCDSTVHYLQIWDYSSLLEDLSWVFHTYRRILGIYLYRLSPTCWQILCNILRYMVGIKPQKWANIAIYLWYAHNIRISTNSVRAYTRCTQTWRKPSLPLSKQTRLHPPNRLRQRPRHVQGRDLFARSITRRWTPKALIVGQGLPSKGWRV